MDHPWSAAGVKDIDHDLAEKLAQTRFEKVTGQKTVQELISAPMAFKTRTRLVENMARDAGPIDGEWGGGEYSYSAAWDEDTGGAAGSGRQPPLEQDDHDFEDDEQDEKRNSSGARLCPDCSRPFLPGEVACDCGYTSQPREKAPHDDAQSTKMHLNIEYEAKFSDRGARSVVADRQRR